MIVFLFEFLDFSKIKTDLIIRFTNMIIVMVLVNINVMVIMTLTIILTVTIILMVIIILMVMIFWMVMITITLVVYRNSVSQAKLGGGGGEKS